MKSYKKLNKGLSLSVAPASLRSLWYTNSRWSNWFALNVETQGLSDHQIWLSCMEGISPEVLK